jgi:cobalamin-dependent methionine synthase I
LATAAFDDAAIRETLDIAFAQRLPAQVFDERVSPALVKVGELWETGELTVAHEHLLAALVRDRLVERLEHRLPSQGDSSALLACVDEEQHDIGLLGFALHVASWGIRPVVLGARVPPAALEATISRARPRFVGLSIVRPLLRARAKALFAEYSRALRGQHWVLGGPAASAVAEFAEAAGSPRTRSARFLTGAGADASAAPHPAI